MLDLISVKNSLSELKTESSGTCFRYRVGYFTIHICPARSEGHSSFSEGDMILNHKEVDIILTELIGPNDSKEQYQSYIDLEEDKRFSGYQPIKYSNYAGLSMGSNITITHLCELIIYLHRLINLVVFT